MAFPLLATALGAFFTKAIGPILFKIMAIIGISVVSYQGIDLVLTELRTIVETNMSGLPPELIDVLGAINVDVYISMVFSAILAKWTIKGLAGGVMKALRW